MGATIALNSGIDDEPTSLSLTLKLLVFPNLVVMGLLLAQKHISPS
jgi:hypothetical protein